MAKTVKQIQKATDDWVVRNGGYWSHFEQMAALVEECGEVAKELHHLHGPKKKKVSDEGSSLSDELGDLLFVVACLANSNNVDLEKAFEETLKKYNSRDKNRWKKTGKK